MAAAKETETVETQAEAAPEAAPEPEARGKAKAETVREGSGIERYECSKGDFLTYADLDSVKAHIASSH